MVENVIKTFKLNYDGSFDEIAYSNIKEVFTIVNILAIYIIKIKTMYIWIGKNATQALKNHIPNIRVILKEDFPQFRIIRNITFDMRSEPLEFFKNLNLNKQDLYEIINYQEKTVIPILEKINDLKEKSDELIKSEDYNNAIDILKEIIGLAIKIEDDALVTEQKRLISKLTEKFENHKIVSEIIEDTSKVEEEYNKLIKLGNLLDAHHLIESFKKKYEIVYDLLLIEDAKALILKEKKKWNAEQVKIKNDLLKLEKEIYTFLENQDISKAIENHEKGLTLLSNLTDDTFKEIWNKLKDNIKNSKEKKDFITKFDFLSNKIVKLKESNYFTEIKKIIEDLITQVQILDLPEYRGKLDLLKKDIDSEEQSYNNLLNEITELEEKVKESKINNSLEEVIIWSNEIINLAKRINNLELVNDYSIIIETTKKEIKDRKDFEERQEKLRIELLKLEESFKLSLKSMEIENLAKLIEKAEIYLTELLDNEVDEKWKRLKNKFDTVKLLLENIEELSKNAMKSLNKGNCVDSLGYFEQIVVQLQEYKK
ncbi:MAG: hypothetical protein ACFE9Z_11580 [Promethearchaeota archaeon]